MTKKEISRLTAMRTEGKTLGAIAKELKLSVNTVKSYCRRHGIEPEGKIPVMIAPGTLACRNCGKPVKQTPGRKNKLFCCNKCRNEWWNHHLDKVNRKALYHFTCACCGKEFTAYGDKERKYCSHECYIRDRFGEKDNDKK